MKTPLFLLMLLISLGLSSCITPAKVRPVRHGLGRNDPQPNQIHALITRSLAGPADEEAAFCLGEVVKIWKREKMPVQADISSDAPEGGGVIYRVRFDATPRGTYRLDEFDEIKGAYDYEIARLPLHAREGLGIPLVGIRQNRNEEPIERYYAPEVISRPITAVANVGRRQGNVQPVTIQLLNPGAHATLVANGKTKTVAADFSVPWAIYLSRAGRLNRIVVLDMMSPSPRRPAQLYLMEPYDRNKEPIIMIHGLLSNPLAWSRLTNEVWGNEELSKRYQVWHYLYNPSAPALYSAEVLRSQLRELRHLLDPDGNDPAMRKTTIVAHSMGGLVGKALVANPGVALRKSVFTVPLEELKLTPEDRAQLQDIFAWQPDHSIHRLIFFAVPHRGTAFADNIIGRIGSRLTNPPEAYQSLFDRVSKANPGAFTPGADALSPSKLNGVRSLSPSQPTLRLMADLPLPPGVKVHSIIGNRGRPGPIENSSDGFVPYSSSHVEGAASELIVPTGHRSFNHPQAIAEIIRVLKLR